MKFQILCIVEEKNKKGFYAYYNERLQPPFFIENVLLSESFDESTLGILTMHDFILVVNKRGQLSCLCIK